MPHGATNPCLTSLRNLQTRQECKLFVNPETKSKLEYECQYEETNFRFIQRLARQYQEWLYYDGQNLVFGKPQALLDDQADIRRGTIRARCLLADTCPTNKGKFLPFGERPKPITVNPPIPQPDKNTLGQAAFDSSLALFTAPAVQRAEPRITNKGELDAYFQRKQQSDGAASSFITGESDCRILTVGSIIDVHTAIHTGIGIHVKNSIGTYIITEITHIAGMGDSYQNYFTALPSSIPTLPCPDVPLPVAHTQQAVVVSNEDPKS